MVMPVMIDTVRIRGNPCRIDHYFSWHLYLHYSVALLYPERAHSSSQASGLNLKDLLILLASRAEI